MRIPPKRRNFSFSDSLTNDPNTNRRTHEEFTDSETVNLFRSVNDVSDDTCLRLFAVGDGAGNQGPLNRNRGRPEWRSSRGRERGREESGYRCRGPIDDNKRRRRIRTYRLGSRQVYRDRYGIWIQDSSGN